MIATLVIANSGRAMADLTRTLCGIPDLEIVRYACGRTGVGALVRTTDPDLVLIDDMQSSADALARLAEVRLAAPAAAVVVLAVDTSAGWLADALRGGAAAVLPGSVDAATLGVVLREAVTQVRRPEIDASLAA